MDCIKKLIELYGDRNWKKIEELKLSHGWTEHLFVSQNDPTHFASVSISESHTEIQDCFTGECKLPFGIEKYKQSLLDYCNSSEFINDWLQDYYQTYEELLKDSHLTDKDFKNCMSPENWHYDYTHDPNNGDGTYTYRFSNDKSEIYVGWVEVDKNGGIGCYTEND
jgi:hypothetical protein